MYHNMGVVILAFAAFALPTAAYATNLITNGNFEAGNAGFTSDYVYSLASNTAEGQYTVRANPSPWNPFFLSRGDHTTGSGLMYVGNGSATLGAKVWQSGTIAINTNSNYFFEAFVMNVCCTPNYTGANSDPVLTFSVSLDGGTPFELGTRTIPANQAGIWFGLTTNFNSGSATSAVVSLINANTAPAGNDFAIDDINLSTRSTVIAVPEPATWTMLLAGFGMAGTALRRRVRVSPV